MCVFARVASWCFRFFLGVFLSVCPLAAGGRQMVRKSYCFQAFFCVSHFLLFLFRFCVCFLFARPSVSSNFVFCRFFCSPFVLVSNPLCFDAFFLGFFFFLLFLFRFCVWFGSHSWSVPALEMTIHLFLDILFEILPYHFSWQAQHLARLESDTCCSPHCKRRFICNDDEACKSFCVAGAVFGQVGS